MLSAVAVGKAYEAAIARRLAHAGCSLSALGGAFDQCVDLAGTWALQPPPARRAPPWPGDAVQLLCTVTAAAPAAPADALLLLPPPPPPLLLAVVVQCKATRSPAGVGTMREFVHAVAARFPEDTLAVLACTGGFSWRSLRREREWATRDVLLLHTTPSGGLLGLLHLRQMGAAERLPVTFSSAPLA
jgi:hypothetical protein